MGNNSIQSLIKEINELYFSIGSVKCPSLDNEEIYFKPYGHRHLYFKGSGRPRPTSEMLLKLYLFKDYAVKVIQEGDAVETTRNVEPKKNENKNLRYWTVSKKINSYNICVTLRQRGKNGAKQYISMKRIKLTKKPR